jgi:hypothetical protein
MVAVVRVAKDGRCLEIKEVSDMASEYSYEWDDE